MAKRPKVYYVCFYADSNNSKHIISYPSVWSKIDYICSTIVSAGFDVEIVSEAPSTKGLFKGYKYKKSQSISVKYFSSYHSMNSFANRICTLIHWIKIVFYLLLNVKSKDRVLIYHSIYNLRWLWFFKHIIRRRYYLEIEDVFSQLEERNRKYEEKEIRAFLDAECCLCVNDIIARRLEKKGCKTIVSYGSYNLPNYNAHRKEEGKVRLVYAGVIEQKRKAAFLAIETMRFLDEHYALSILGFGEKKDLDALESLITEVNRTTGLNNVSFIGQMTGDEYIAFLQKCNIGLSTHMYDMETMKSADNTFPSKVLVYLSNGLSVVAQKLDCLEYSKVSDLIQYYNDPSPQNVAEAIKLVKYDVDTRKRIKELDDVFIEEMSLMLKGELL